MKKIFRITLTIGMILFLFVIFYASQNASGAAKNGLIGVEEKNDIDQIGPPWLNEGWHYRQPVFISNNGAPIAYYHVLIRLDSTNFEFDRTMVDGSDILFTDSSGKNLISFRKESWDKSLKLAYFWVLVSSLSPEPYDTVIYMYYGNPMAISQSNGVSTFDSFDDNWCQFPGAVCTPNPPFVWSIISGSPSVSPSNPGVLNFVTGTGIKSTSTYQYQALGFRANYGSGAGHVGTGHEWGGFNIGSIGTGTMIGDLPSDELNLYLMNYNSTEYNTILPQVSGNWHNQNHVYELHWKNGWSEGIIDHDVASRATSTVQVPSTFLPVTFYSYTGSNATLQVDWVYVRQFRDPEPIATTNKNDEQRLIKLAINNIDTPDPVRVGANLSYQITISNASNMDATGVIMTDTLPGVVNYVSAIPSQGSCNSEVICTLGTIGSNESATITINVIPKNDGNIINNAIVGSPGFELDLSDNTSQAETLVDSEKPVVSWIKPVQNRQSYITADDLITLQASASDNDQIARVEFWQYDGTAWVYINSSYSLPYQVQFDATILVPNQQYPVEVYAFDRAGNQNALEPENLRQVIYIKRLSLHPIYLPLASK